MTTRDFTMLTLLLEIGSTELSFLLSPFDLKRLDSYANNQLDYHVIMDLLPAVGQLFFEKRLGPEVRLSAVQSSILLAISLQHKTIEEIEVSVPPIFCLGITDPIIAHRRASCSSPYRRRSRSS